MSALTGWFRDLSLRVKVTLTLVVVFTLSLAALLLTLVPILGEQRQRLVDQDRRLLTTLRRNYERDFIYDLLQQNLESLSVHLADLALQDGVVWARVEADGLDFGATGDPDSILRMLGDEARPWLGQSGIVLVVDGEGRAELVGVGGRPLLSDRQVHREETKTASGSSAADEFQETTWGGEPVLALSSSAAKP